MSTVYRSMLCTECSGDVQGCSLQEVLCCSCTPAIRLLFSPSIISIGGVFEVQRLRHQFVQNIAFYFLFLFRGNTYFSERERSRMRLPNHNLLSAPFLFLFLLGLGETESMMVAFFFFLNRIIATIY